MSERLGTFTQSCPTCLNFTQRGSVRGKPCTDSWHDIANQSKETPREELLRLRNESVQRKADLIAANSVADQAVTELATLRTAHEALSAEKWEQGSLLASTTDLLNTWARESNVTEAQNEKGIRDLVDRLWSKLSGELCAQRRQIAALSAQVADMRARKDVAYDERNRMVAVLTKLFPASLERHPDEDLEWEDDWRWVVYIDSPAGQLSWHIHDRQVPMFEHLPRFQGRKWDGHTTEDKYKRLAEMPVQAAEVAEVAGLREDKARLDFMQNSQADAYFEDETWYVQNAWNVVCGRKEGEAKTLRAAIDAARGQEKKDDR